MSDAEVTFPAPAAEPAPHETVDGTPDSFLDNLSPTPKGRSRKKAKPPPRNGGGI